MKNLKNISEMTRNPQVDKISAKNVYMDCIKTAHENGDIETEKMLIKLLKIQEKHIDETQTENE